MDAREWSARAFPAELIDHIGSFVFPDTAANYRRAIPDFTPPEHRFEFSKKWADTDDFEAKKKALMASIKAYMCRYKDFQGHVFVGKCNVVYKEYHCHSLIHDIITEMLIYWPNIRSLDINFLHVGFPIIYKTLEAIRGFKQLETLFISKSYLTFPNVENVWPRLKKIHINPSSAVNCEDLMSITTLSTLQEVFIEHIGCYTGSSVENNNVFFMLLKAFVSNPTMKKVHLTCFVPLQLDEDQTRDIVHSMNPNVMVTLENVTLKKSVIVDKSRWDIR